MECINKSCTITGTDRMVSCWLCNGYCHLKCSGGLKPRDADALLDKTKYLQWTCLNCRKIRVEFYNLFQGSRNEFEIIRRDFCALNDKLLKYGELFSKFSSLENFVSTSQSLSPKRKKISENQPQLPSIQKIIPSIQIIDTLATNASNSYQNEVMPETPIQSSAPVNNQQLSTSPIPTIISIPETPVPMAVNEPSTSNAKISPKVPKNLQTIPPRRTIFASRFVKDTTIEDISSFLQTKFNIQNIENVTIYKINSRNRASFKIIVPEFLFDMIVNPEVWPKHAIIREFVYRDNDNVRIPKATNQSKN